MNPDLPKAGVTTSEFWLTAGSATSAFAYIVSEAPDGQHALAAALVVVGAGLYAIARSMAKGGAR